MVVPRGFEGWIVTRYDDAKAALTDPTISKDAAGFAPLIERHAAPGTKPVTFRSELTKHMLNSDPPDHTRMRKLVTRVFSVKAVQGLRDRTERIAEDLLDALAPAAAAGAAHGAGPVGVEADGALADPEDGGACCAGCC